MQRHGHVHTKKTAQFASPSGMSMPCTELQKSSFCFLQSSSSKGANSKRHLLGNIMPPGFKHLSRTERTDGSLGAPWRTCNAFSQEKNKTPRAKTLLKWILATCSQIAGSSPSWACKGVFQNVKYTGGLHCQARYVRGWAMACHLKTLSKKSCIGQNCSYVFRTIQ